MYIYYIYIHHVMGTIIVRMMLPKKIRHIPMVFPLYSHYMLYNYPYYVSRSIFIHQYFLWQLLGNFDTFLAAGVDTVDIERSPPLEQVGYGNQTWLGNRRTEHQKWRFDWENHGKSLSSEIFMGVFLIYKWGVSMGIYHCIPWTIS